MERAPVPSGRVRLLRGAYMSSRSVTTAFNNPDPNPEVRPRMNGSARTDLYENEFSALNFACTCTYTVVYVPQIFDRIDTGLFISDNCTSSTSINAT